MQQSKITKLKSAVEIISETTTIISTKRFIRFDALQFQNHSLLCAIIAFSPFYCLQITFFSISKERLSIRAENNQQPITFKGFAYNVSIGNDFYVPCAIQKLCSIKQSNISFWSVNEMPYVEKDIYNDVYYDHFITITIHPLLDRNFDAISTLEKIY